MSPDYNDFHSLGPSEPCEGCDFPRTRGPWWSKKCVDCLVGPARVGEDMLRMLAWLLPLVVALYFATSFLGLTVFRFYAERGYRAGNADFERLCGGHFTTRTGLIVPVIGKTIQLGVRSSTPTVCSTWLEKSEKNLAKLPQ